MRFPQFLSVPALALPALFVIAAIFATPARAADPCDQLDTLYPQPGRGAGGDNAFRPLPLFVPTRPEAGAPGTLGLSIAVDHVIKGPKGKPGYVYVGNYPVTDIPVFKLAATTDNTVTVVDPQTGQATPISNACLGAHSWGFGGSLWSLIQGDTLDVLLQSRLDYSGSTSIPIPTNGAEPCRSSNLHTHGLLVSPYHPQHSGLGPYGDYVLDATEPRGSLGIGTTLDDCGTRLGDVQHKGHGITTLPLHYEIAIPGQPGVNSLKSGEHPSGLFWYHPHVHGFSQFQVHGGATGVITIGALTDYACPEGDGTPGNCTLTNTNVRVLELKDTAIQPYGEGLYNMIPDVESDICSPSGGTRHGECQAQDEKTSPGGKWVFTVNGVEYPVMRADAGRTEIWRIVNASPSFTYRLSITPADKDGAPLPFQLLAKDGVGVHGIHGPVDRTEMLLMPATRIEIAIPAPAQGGAYVLHHTVTSTSANGNTSGNVWPSVDLARIVWEKPKEKDDAQTPAPPVTFQVAGQATPIPHGNADMKGIPPRCRLDVSDTRVIYFVHRFVHVVGFNRGATADADDEADGARSGGAIGINEVFGLIAGIRHADGSMDFYPDGPGQPLKSVVAVWRDGVRGTDAAFPGLGHNRYNNICTVKGNVEHWELQNWTAEDHNFHLHQSKFTLDPSGSFQFPTPRANEGKEVRDTDLLVRKFVELGHDAITYNDTMPVPRGQSICAIDPTVYGCRNKTTTECRGAPGKASCARPGMISVLIDFSRAEQVGSFVYHCHVLEHEDGGMMADIEVMCPPGDSSCGSTQIPASICRPTEASN